MLNMIEMIENQNKNCNEFTQKTILIEFLYKFLTFNSKLHFVFNKLSINL